MTSEMKNILIIHETMNVGGAERVLANILRHFDYERYNVDLLLQYKTGVFLSEIPPQVNVMGLYEAPMKPSLIGKMVRRVAFDYYFRDEKRRMRKVVGGKSYDAVISFMEGYAARMHSFVTDLTPRNISWVHTDLSLNNWYGHLFPQAKAQAFYRNMSEIVFVSEGALKAFGKVYDSDASKRVVYNLTDPDEIRAKARQLDAPSRRFTVCTVGRLSPVKRQDRVVEMARIFKDRGIEADFWIVGDGTEMQNLRAQIDRLDVPDMVTLKGFQKNPAAFIDSADVFVLTSDAEGLAMVVIEAMSLGKPIVATRITGIDELLAEGAGVLCECSAESLAEPVIRLKNDPEKMAEYGSRALERSRAFSPAETMKAIYGLIDG